MLMTHGQTLIEQPGFLERLVVEGGLRQISVHVEMTQAGRHGYPIGRIKSEADLHPVRQAFTGLALDYFLSGEKMQACFDIERIFLSCSGGPPKSSPSILKGGHRPPLQDPRPPNE